MGFDSFFQPGAGVQSQPKCALTPYFVRWDMLTMGLEAACRPSMIEAARVEGCLHKPQPGQLRVRPWSIAGTPVHVFQAYAHGS